MNQFLIVRIYHNPIPFQSPIKKNKFKSFHEAVERMEVSSCWKTKSAKVNMYILGPLTSLLVPPGKAINYEKAIAFTLPSVLLPFQYDN